MPVQYGDQGISASHVWTRTKCSIFDVSHMVQHHIYGPGAAGLLAKITPCAPDLILPFHSGLSALLNEEGGIVDDTIITNITQGDPKGKDGMKFYVVTNAGCRDKDLAFLKKEIDTWNKANSNMQVKHDILDSNGLIAVQGPLAAEILDSLKSIDAKTGSELDVSKLYFGQCAYVSFGDIKDCLVSRGGYTGEDGFEISVPQGSASQHQVISLCQKMLEAGGQDKIRMAGLGARDSLRLEAGMCLYGHDIDETTTPVEAGLAWIITKERRKHGGFHGSSKILEQLKPVREGGAGPPRRRIGLIVNDPAPAREGAEIQNSEGKTIGKVTSGGPSPSLGKNIAMGYVENGFHKAGTELSVLVRKKSRPAVVSKMPFIDAKYWRAPAEKKPAA